MDNKEVMKKEGEELQQFLSFRRRSFKIRAKKGRGAEYNREDFRKETRKEEESEHN